MSLNDVSKAERLHIGIFGQRNVGKSSLINAITGQNLAIVSDVAGTTTDPVYKAMELLPVGPVMLVDTPGLDDEGGLGQQRIEQAEKVLKRADLALLVVGESYHLSEGEAAIEKKILEANVPYIIVHNKVDIVEMKLPGNTNNIFWVSAKTGENITELKEAIACKLQVNTQPKFVVADLIEPEDTVILVTPIDSAAPKGRLILPQQQTLREILDKKGIAIVVQVEQLQQVLQQLKSLPKLIITDSQVFEEVAELSPKEIPLTSFSILFARYKGILQYVAEGAKTVEMLQNSDKILICEGCTHHKQCDDIGTVKIPNWLKKYTQKELQFDFVSGNDFPEDIGRYKLIVHCGGCMLQEREVQQRMRKASEAHVPIINYGTLIAYLKGILERSLEVFL